MKILIISTAFNGMTQRIHQELILDKHHVSVELAISDEHMLEAVTLFSPDIIICPFLTKRIPKVIWKNTPCLIVHPGIEGDRGPSSIDWAIMEAQYEWGVTLLQASEEMDAGNIWETSTFPLRRNSSKSSTYRSEVIQAAAKLVRYAVNKFATGDVAPRPLNYKNEHVKGTLKPIMRQDARGIDWHADNTETVLKKLNASDSCPGVLINLEGIKVYAFGASPEIYLKGKPGSLIATHYDSICLATVDGAVWIKQLKLKPAEMKLPATLLLNQLKIETASQVPNLLYPNYSPNYYADEISIRTKENIAYLYFDFYNGAMDTQQCNRLKDTFNTLKVNDAIDVIVLMGGEQFWSNGIHLKVIEASSDPADESWKNINAINDLIYEILNCITFNYCCSN